MENKNKNQCLSSVANQNGPSRRKFIQASAASIAAASFSTLGGLGFTASSYARIIGANDRLNMAVIGLHGRGKGLIKSIQAANNAHVVALCDVDSKVLEQAKSHVSSGQVTGFEDFRQLLELKAVDAVAIATPDHWHTPMTLSALDAGKHVYVEKPCGHNPYEGELLVKAQKKYANKVIQMGNQQRSAPTSIQAIKDIGEGIIGDVYYAKTWYSNDRKSIGTGKASAIPQTLNWDLWQGPAPRKAYKDNFVHYNWHWFWHWGTGETCNNAAHELDIARWALNVNYPKKVSSSGGRYHFQDDWEFFDTQNVSFEFEQGKMITWEGRSCNPLKQHKRGRGTTLHGTKGSIFLDRNMYQVFDMDNQIIKTEQEQAPSATTDIVGLGNLDILHMNNFFDVIRTNARPNSPIDQGHISILLCHLANIAQKHGGMLDINTKNGKIINNKKAMTMWRRSYEKGWQPKV